MNVFDPAKDAAEGGVAVATPPNSTQNSQSGRTLALPRFATMLAVATGAAASVALAGSVAARVSLPRAVQAWYLPDGILVALLGLALAPFGYRFMSRLAFPSARRLRPWQLALVIGLPLLFALAIGRPTSPAQSQDWQYLLANGGKEAAHTATITAGGAARQALFLPTPLVAELQLAPELTRKGGKFVFEVTPPPQPLPSGRAAGGAIDLTFVADNGASQRLIEKTRVAIAEPARASWRRVTVPVPPATTRLEMHGMPVDDPAFHHLFVHVVKAEPRFAAIGRVTDRFSFALLFLVFELVALYPTQSAASQTRARLIDLHQRWSGAGVNRHAVIYFLLFVLGTNVWLAYFLSQEHTLYEWDYVGYWNSSRDYCAALHGPFKAAVHVLIDSIQHQDYNFLPAVPIALVMRVLGTSRFVYLLCVLNIYVVPIALLLYLFLNRQLATAAANRPGRNMAIAALTMLISAPFWFPLLQGYIDVGGVPIAMAIVLLYFSASADELPWPRAVACGLLLCALYLFRRWYAYWVVSFVLLASVDGLATLLRRWPSWRSLVASVRSVVLMGGTAAAALWLCARPLVERVLATNYTDTMSAFKRYQGLKTYFANAGEHFGYGFVVLAAACWLWLLVRPGTRRVGLFLAAQIVVILIHFNHTATPWINNYYLCYPGVFGIVALGLVTALGALPWRPARALVCGVPLAWGLVCALLAFSTRTTSWHDRAIPWVPTMRLLPMVRSDLAEWIKMTDTLSHRLAAPEATLCVLSSSPVLNESHFYAIEETLPVNFSVRNHLRWTSHIDKRDGFPKSLLDVRFVLVASPPQFHMGEQNQQVIGIPARSLLQHTDIGCAFVKLPDEFHLDGGVTAYLYEKVRPIAPAELDAFSARLRAIYPDHPNVYSPAGKP